MIKAVLSIKTLGDLHFTKQNTFVGDHSTVYHFEVPIQRLLCWLTSILDLLNIEEIPL